MQQIGLEGDDKMRRRFNITGSCNPQRHYMVNLDERVKKLKKILLSIEAGSMERLQC